MSIATAVPQALVHKSDPEQTLLTSWQRLSDSVFSIRANWSQAQLLFPRPPGTAPGTLPLLECIRQSFPLLSHAAYDVPLGHHLLWETFDYTVLPVRPAPALSHSDALELLVTCRGEEYRGKRPVRLELGISVRQGSCELAVADSRFTIQPPAVYRRLRPSGGDVDSAMRNALAPCPPADPRMVGAAVPEEVALSPGSSQGQWLLRVDLQHPVFFDHPVDHVPGLLLLEAARQAASAVSVPAAVPAGMQTVFHRYVDLDAPCHVVARPSFRDSASRCIQVSMHQNGRECFSSQVALAPALCPAAA